MPRFFVSGDENGGSFMVLTGENAAHAKVLRLKNGDEVTVCDGCGTDYRCTVSDVAAGQISLVVHGAAPAQSEATVECAIYMAFAKADKFEHVIQKATELGATELVCFPTSRCVSRPEERALEKKLERWQKIAESAAKQSKRDIIPEVQPVQTMAQMLAANDCATKIIAYECEDKKSLKAALKEAQAKGALTDLLLIIGPEGGISEAELEAARAAGAVPVSLGRRILRAETAGLVAISAIFYETGDLGD